MADTLTAPERTIRFSSLFNRARPKGHGLLVLASLVVADPSYFSNVLGAVTVCLGEALRLWASGYLQKFGALCTSGPYAHVRHPLYLGTMVMAIGFGVLINQWQRWYLSPLLLALVVVVYALQIMLEERQLRRHYGPAYQEYAQSVPALFPRLRYAAKDNGCRFTWTQVRFNREHLRAYWTIFALALFELKTELVKAGMSWLSPFAHH